MAKYLGIPLTVSNGTTETPTYGSPQLIPNSDFTSGSGWDFSAGSGASISNNQLTFANSPDEAFASTIPVVLQKYKRYVVKVDIASLTGDNPRIRVTAGGDGSTYSPYYTSAGVYTHTFTANANTTNGKLQVYFYTGSTGGATVNSVTLYEEPYVIGTREFVKNGSFTTDSDWFTGTGISISNNAMNFTSQSGQYGSQPINIKDGVAYKINFEITTQTSGQLNIFLGAGNNVGLLSGLGKQEIIALADTSIDTRIYFGDVFSGSIDNVSVKELEYNYLQVSDGGFKKSVKEGDVIFNTSTSTEGVIKEVLDNNALLMSNDNFSTAGELFNVFAANGDTRGNQVVRTDNYIMSEYDENTTNPQETSFWFAGGVNADKVALTQLNAATNTFFVAGVIEEYLERLNAQSATASRLDIPLDAFRDHKNNEVLVTTAITLS